MEKINSRLEIIGNFVNNVLRKKNIVILVGSNGIKIVVYYKDEVIDSIFIDYKEIIIGVGMPTKIDKGICISMIIFQPYKMRQIYSKKYLHPGEEKYFVSGHFFCFANSCT
jgi:hypothetical protein